PDRRDFHRAFENSRYPSCTLPHPDEHPSLQCAPLQYRPRPPQILPAAQLPCRLHPETESARLFPEPEQERALFPQPEADFLLQQTALLRQLRLAPMPEREATYPDTGQPQKTSSTFRSSLESSLIMRMRACDRRGF